MLADMTRSEQRRRRTRCAALFGVGLSSLFSLACGEASQSDAAGADSTLDGPNGAPNSGAGGDGALGNTPEPGSSNDPSSPGDPSEQPGPDMTSVPTPGQEPVAPATTSEDNVTRVARLSRQQYQNTVSDLLGIDDPPGEAFAPDALNGFPFDTSVDYRVDARLGPQYRAAAEQLSTRVVSDDPVFQHVVPCDESAANCAQEFIDGFGQRAFRRPLDAAESTRFSDLFAQGPNLVASGNDFRDGVRLVVEAMLQSPQFLYRTELSNTAGAEGRIALGDWEIASRLSYFLWDTMPDQALFDAAQAGQLQTSAQLESQVSRMLDDARATVKLVSFHEQVFLFNRLSGIAPDRNVYPDAPEDLAQRATEAGRLFLQDVVNSDGGFRELLTAPYAYADSSMAPLYGENLGGDFERIDFTGGERKGMLMQVGFLAANAYAIKTDPIHRGLFVVRNLLCRNIPDPPPGASQETLPATESPPETTRDEIALLTGTNVDATEDQKARCGTCHALINPPGFAFESFDATGQVRAQEDGVTVNTSGELLLDGQMVSFENASDLVESVASSAEGSACYTSKLESFAFGHDFAPADADLTAALGQSALSAKAIASLIAGSASFRERVPNEVAP